MPAAGASGLDPALTGYIQLCKFSISGKRKNLNTVYGQMWQGLIL